MGDRILKLLHLSTSEAIVFYEIDSDNVVETT